MKRPCPSCRSTNVRRSSTPANEVTWRNRLLSRYRCRECLTQFWMIGRKSYVAAGTFLGVIVLTLIAVLVLEWMLAPVKPPPGRRRSEIVPWQQPHVPVVAPVGAGLQGAWPRPAPPKAFKTRESMRS